MTAAVPSRRPRVWRQPVAFRAFALIASVAFFVLGFVVAWQVSDGWKFALMLWLPWVPATWLFLLRPRLVVEDDEVVVFGVFATRRYQLREITNANPTGYGTYFELFDGRVFCASTLARPNYAAWLGRPSRADRVATEIVSLAAELRGEPAPEPLGFSRSMGDILLPPPSLLD